MTFFANSGAKFPNLEQPTREAGSRALRGAADLWRLFATIEGRSDGAGEDDERIIKACIENLTRSLDIYKSIISNISTEDARLSPAEMELANIGPSWEGDWYYTLPPWDLRRLYTEIVRRLEMLISQLHAFEVRLNKENLVQQVFSMMRQWETLARLGRVIAVVNRRR
jgi:hypothetical protein